MLSPAICQATHCSHKLPSAGTHLIRRRSVNEALRGPADNGGWRRGRGEHGGRLQYVKRTGGVNGLDLQTAGKEPAEGGAGEL